MVGENGVNGQSAMLNVPQQTENKLKHENATAQFKKMEERIVLEKTRKKKAAKSTVVSHIYFSLRCIFSYSD